MASGSGSCFAQARSLWGEECGRGQHAPNLPIPACEATPADNPGRPALHKPMLDARFPCAVGDLDDIAAITAVRPGSATRAAASAGVAQCLTTLSLCR